MRLRSFVFDSIEIFSGLQIVKTKAYEYAIIYMSVPTARYFRQKLRREDNANINETN